ncbi:hypothetical protein G6N05_05330 [Flavobacterium sp. F372]|uniref:Uncharacterized protein n=1 Tax=Flavobacterium bernardetii TaxID=2813823 RepID=A0ABR7J264_9FLAO|nr:hypothetical protein [Flavobacterium bernardetii]MBC5835802.1 hypothetical protein [Flavobacterium bernardetii]NHF69533.1 hypothetical protein [Flavobacterium bernardetii]
MITNFLHDNYKNITRVSILDAKKVFYPMKYVLEKRDILIDDDSALIILPFPEDIKYPSNTKMTDAGMLWDYKVEISINNQSALTENQLMRFLNKKVIVVFHHNDGKIIFGCNEMPLQYGYSEDNSVNPAAHCGYSVECRGNSYYSKVST